MKEENEIDYAFNVVNEIVQVVTKLQSLENKLMASPENEFWNNMINKTEAIHEFTMKMWSEINEYSEKLLKM